MVKICLQKKTNMVGVQGLHYSEVLLYLFILFHDAEAYPLTGASTLCLLFTMYLYYA